MKAACRQVRDLVAMISLEARDEMEFDGIGNGALRLRKMNMRSFITPSSMSGC